MEKVSCDQWLIDDCWFFNRMNDGYRSIVASMLVFFRFELILDSMHMCFQKRKKREKRIDFTKSRVKRSTREVSVSEKSKARLVIYAFNRIAIARDRFSLHLSFYTIASPRSSEVIGESGVRIPYQGTKPDLIDVSHRFFALLRSDCPLSPSGIAILRLVSHHHICLINPANTIWLERVICFNSFDSVAFARYLLSLILYPLYAYAIRKSFFVRNAPPDDVVDKGDLNRYIILQSFFRATKDKGSNDTWKDRYSTFIRNFTWLR